MVAAIKKLLISLSNNLCPLTMVNRWFCSVLMTGTRVMLVNESAFSRRFALTPLALRVSGILSFPRILLFFSGTTSSIVEPARNQMIHSVCSCSLWVSTLSSFNSQAVPGYSPARRLWRRPDCLSSPRECWGSDLLYDRLWSGVGLIYLANEVYSLVASPSPSRTPPYQGPPLLIQSRAPTRDPRLSHWCP